MIFLYRTHVKTTSVLSNVKDSYKALARVYKKRHNTDSVAKYAELACVMTDSLHAVKNTTHLRQMQAVYDYSRQQREIERARRQNILIRTISFVSISILLLVIVALLLSIKRKREKRKAWLIKYNEYVARLKSAKQDLEVLLLKKQSEIDDIIEKKRLEIEIIGQGKKGYERKIRNNSVNVGADLYLENELYSKLKHHIEKDLQPMTNKEISWLENCFKDYMSLAIWKNRLKSVEYLVCLLVKIGFTPSEVAVLTARSKSDVANIRKRLMLKMTGHDGSSKEFDEFIKAL